MYYVPQVRHCLNALTTAIPLRCSAAQPTRFEVSSRFQHPMQSSDSIYTSVFSQTSSPLVNYVYTANHLSAQPEPIFWDDQIDPALLEEQRLEQQLSTALTEELSRLDKREQPQQTETALSRVSELRMEEGGYAYEEPPAKEEEEEDVRMTSGRIPSTALGDCEDEQRSILARSSEISNEDNKDSMQAANPGVHSSTRVAVDEDNTTPSMLTQYERKRSYSNTELIELLSKPRKSS